MSLEECKQFIDIFLTKVAAAGFDVAGLQPDHIAYYTATKEEYDDLKPEFEKLGKFEHEAIIRDRRVGVLKLTTPIIVNDYKIEALELIEPTVGEVAKSRWEHGEFVTQEPYESILQKHSELTWETGSMARPIYSHITAVLEDGIKVKFHHLSILENIELEKRQTAIC